MPPISTTQLLEIADRVGTPAYVYDLDQIRRRVADIRAALQGSFRVSYAVKANPHPAILGAMLGLVDALDVSSSGEIDKALAAGWPAERIGFTGPAKRNVELQRAIDVGLGDVIVESLDEIETLGRLAMTACVQQAVLIRVCPNTVVPGFGSRMAGKPTQFGIEEGLLDEAIRCIRALPGLRLEGLHLYAGTQCLNADAIIAHVDTTLELFDEVCNRHDIVPRRLIVGSGFGIPYHDNDQPLDLQRVGDAVRERVTRFRTAPRYKNVDLLLETGRYLVGEAGVYLTRVVTTKTSRGHAVAVCDGGMHHHLAAAGHLGSVLHRNYPISVVAHDLPPEQTWVPHLIFGALCTSIDLLGNQVRLPPLARGDVLAIACSGAYGFTSSPLHFISHPPPVEIILDSLRQPPSRIG